MYQSLLNSKEIRPNPEKRWEPAEGDVQHGGPQTRVLAGAGTP